MTSQQFELLGLAAEVSRRCRWILRHDDRAYCYDSAERAQIRRLVIVDREWELYINEVGGSLDVGVRPVGDPAEYARTAYADIAEFGPVTICIEDTVHDVCLPILRRLMVLDDLADV